MSVNDEWTGDRRRLREALAERRQQLIEELQLRMARIRENGSDPVPASDAEDGDTNDLDVVLVDITTATLHRIDQAIERLDDGRYGVCTRCRGPIGEARLRALPFAVCCRECESARESEAAVVQSAGRRRPWIQGSLGDDEG
jgi:RNA polymerase-binding protein DksA